MEYQLELFILSNFQTYRDFGTFRYCRNQWKSFFEKVVISNYKVLIKIRETKSHLGIASHLFRKSHYDHINKFVEAHSYHFTPLQSLNANITDNYDDSDLVADVDLGTLIRIVRHEKS